MSIYEAVNPQTLRQLLNEIDSGASVLPDFQRDFVWDPAATQNLVISVASEFPAGSLLRVRDTQNAFATRHFEGVTRNQRHTFLVLDGQQRLTSLYQAFYGVGEYRFFIDLEKIKDDEDLSNDGTFFFLRASRRGVLQKETDIAVHASERILPLSVIYGREGGFWKWESDVRKLLPPEQQNQFEIDIRQLHGKWVQRIEQYQFPVVTLNDSATSEALCTIFETLNKTGVKLSVFELLTARFWRFGINLREKWDSATNQYPIFEDYEVDPYAVLQAISLIVNLPASCKKRDVLNLSAENINHHWDFVLEKMAYGLQILRDDCKVMSRKWLPTSSMLGPLAAVLCISGAERGPDVAIHRGYVRRWLWCSIFGQRYEAAANTRAEKDVNDIAVAKNSQKQSQRAIPTETSRKGVVEIPVSVKNSSAPVYRSMTNQTVCDVNSTILQNTNPIVIDLNSPNNQTADLFKTDTQDIEKASKPRTSAKLYGILSCYL